MSNRSIAFLLLAASALASPIAFAAHGTASQSTWLKQSAIARQASSLTRQQVALETLMARRNGTLQPAGEAVVPAFRSLAVSRLSRADVMRDTDSARANGQLRPAGEAVAAVFADASGPAKTRDQIKQETRTARFNGTLLPAGDAADEQTQMAGI